MNFNLTTIFPTPSSTVSSDSAEFKIADKDDDEEETEDSLRLNNRKPRRV
jgi:hypothetical protein